MRITEYLKSMLIAVLVLAPVASIASACKGHILFYNLDEDGGEADTDADFAFYYQRARKWLPGAGVSFSVHTELPITAATCFLREVYIEEHELAYSLGYVFVKPTLEKKVIGGVLTDVDIDRVVNEFFQK
jgi:hypothetical protein